MITPEQFDNIYAGTPVMDYKHIFFTEPDNDIDIEQNRLISKLWRLNNLYTIVDKKGKRIRFEMNLAQHKVFAASMKHPRLIILKSRQQGISTLWLIYFFDDALFCNDFSIGLMAQGEVEASTLLERTEILWDELDPSIKDFLAIRVVKQNTKEYSFSSGSTIFIRTSFRSTTLQRLHISEFAKIANANPKRARETKTGTLQAIAQGNIAVIESTAEGTNEFRVMWDKAMVFINNMTQKDFYPVFLSWLDDPDCVSERDESITIEAAKYFKELYEVTGRKLTRVQKNFWVMQKRELGVDMSQEYPATAEEAFLATRDGTYYAALYMLHVRNKGRERTNLYDPNLPVRAVFDLGMNDDMHICFVQEYTDGIRIFDEFVDNGEPIEYYCQVMDELPYDVDEVQLPADAEVRDLTSGITREEAFHKHGYTNTVVLDKCVSINDDIQKVRSQLKDGLHIDAEKCPVTVEAFLNYTKEWDDKRGVWKDKPLHNGHSHGADTGRYVVVGQQGYSTPRRRRRSSGMDI